MRMYKFIPLFLIPKRLKKINYKLYVTRQLLTHLLKDYGWVKAMRAGKCIDRDGNAIPWFSYPAIDFLSQFDYSGKKIFEYGCGFSTLYWSKRAKEVVSVEGDEKWIEKIRPQLPSHCTIIPSSCEPEDYAGKISSYEKFDVIVIDGHVKTRTSCCYKSLNHLSPGGIIILDNSDQCLTSAKILRDSGLIQCDFTGFAPLSAHAQTTSVFFSRDYNFEPRNSHQPHKSVAQPAKPYRLG